MNISPDRLSRTDKIASCEQKSVCQACSVSWCELDSEAGVADPGLKYKFWQKKVLFWRHIVKFSKLTMLATPEHPQSLKLCQKRSISTQKLPKKFLIFFSKIIFSQYFPKISTPQNPKFRDLADPGEIWPGLAGLAGVILWLDQSDLEILDFEVAKIGGNNAKKYFLKKKPKNSWEAFVSTYIFSDIVLGFGGAPESLTESISRISRYVFKKAPFFVRTCTFIVSSLRIQLVCREDLLPNLVSTEPPQELFCTSYSDSTNTLTALFQ